MLLITKKEIAELHSVNQENCISIFIPTHRAGKKVLNKEDKLALKIQLKEVKSKLLKKSLHKDVVNKMLLPVQQLIDDSSFWRKQSDGLAIFIADNFYRQYTLPIYFKEFNCVSNLFYLKPLMPLFVGDGEFYLMLLELDNVALYECTRHSFTEINITDLIPEKMEDSVGYDYEEKNLQFRTQKSGAGQVMYHGQEAATGKRKNEIKKYLRAINNGLSSILNTKNKPLIIATQDYLFDIYKDINNYPNLFDNNIKLNFDAIDIFEIHELTWEVIAPIFDQKRKDKIALFLEEQGTGKTAVGIELILPASFNGKIDTLFCENRTDIFGSYKEKNELVIISQEDENNHIISLMNVAVIKTFLNGGEVYLLDKKDMPNSNSKINALYRY